MNEIFEFFNMFTKKENKKIEKFKNKDSFFLAWAFISSFFLISSLILFLFLKNDKINSTWRGAN